MSEFKREIRYNVIKLKTGLPVECVVVEHDWPENPIVWQMIQDRIEGNPNIIERQQQQITSLQRENAELKLWNANLKTNNFKLSREAATILEHCIDLERIIAESKEQKPVAYRHFSSKWSEWHYEDTPFVGRTSEPLYTSPPIQDGMVAVPVEPTEKMLNSQPHAWPDDAREIWKAMIEASKEKI